MTAITHDGGFLYWRLGLYRVVRVYGFLVELLLWRFVDHVLHKRIIVGLTAAEGLRGLGCRRLCGSGGSLRSRD